MGDTEKLIKDIYGLTVVYNKEICKLLTELYELLTTNLVLIQRDTGIRISMPEIYFVKKDEIGGFEFKAENEFCIVIYTGTVVKQRIHLRDIFRKRGVAVDELYIDKLIEYTVLFVVMHEYMHILIGHCLLDCAEKRAQEAEADIEAAHTVIKKVLLETEPDEVENEIVASFIATFYLFKSMEMLNEDEKYSVRVLENHYDDKNRTHPLTSQRIMYIYECYNVFVPEERNIFTNIEDKILNKLLELGEKQDENDSIDHMYRLEEIKISEIQEDIRRIRVKIPRIGKFEDLPVE